MIWFFTPYSFEGHLFEAYDCYMSLIDNNDDWIAFMDGDILFFHADFGHTIEEYIEHYPDTGMFVCLTNRITAKPQLYSAETLSIDSIRYFFLVANNLRRQNHLRTTPVNEPVAGFLMVIRRSTWDLIREKVECEVIDKHFLHVDYAIARSILSLGKSIMRMDSLLVFHYYRFVEGNPHWRGLS